MRNKGTILLGFLAVGLVVYIGFDVWKKPGTTELRREAQKVGIFKYTTVQHFDLAVPKGAFSFERKGDHQWEIEKPIVFPADREFIHEALVEIEIAERLDTLKNIHDWNAALEQYGLKEPRIKITLAADQKSQTISIGRETPVPGTVYALVSDGQKREMIVLSQQIEEFLNRDLDAWRSHEIFDFYPELITHIFMRKDQQEVEIKKNDDRWEIVKPLVTRADSEAIGKFLQDVLQMRAGKFVSENDAAQSSYGLATPSLIFEVSDYKQKRTLKIGSVAPDDANLVYASYESRPAVFMLPQKTLETLGGILNAVRDRRIVSYPYTASVRQVDIHFNGLKAQLRRVGKNTWRIENENRDAEFSLVDNFLGQLFALRVNDYPDVTNENTLGFKKPAAVVRWSEKSAASTQDEEMPASHSDVEEETLTFGAVKGDEIYLQTPRQVSAVTVSRKILDHFPKEIWDWFSLRVLNFKEPLESVTWNASGKTCAVELVDGAWKLRQEEGEINQRLLKLQLKVLRNLTAIRWVGLAQKNDFAKPLLTMALQYGDKTEQLIFAKQLGDGSVLARIGDDKYAFLLSARDFKALTLSPKQADVPSDLESSSQSTE